MLKNSRCCIYIFFALLFCGGYLRLYNLENIPLWQDEAETAFYAKQVLDFRLPNAYDEKRDLFLYIGALIPISNSDSHLSLIDPHIYGFVQEDFSSDGKLIKHPYGDILVTAISFFIFGPSTFSARFLFALIGTFSLILTYKLGRYLYNKKIGLISMAFQTFNIVLIAYERQARHYSLGVFCFLGSLYFGLKAVEKDQIKDYIFTAMFFIGLICGSPITAIAAFLIIFVYNCYSQKTLKWILNKKIMYSLLLLLAFTLMYSSIYQPWRSWHITPVHFTLFDKFFKIALFMVTFSIDCSFLLVCLGIVTLLYRRDKSDILIILVLLSSLLIYSCFIFYTSLYERVMLVIIPFLSMTIARFLNELYQYLQERRFNELLKGAIFYGVLFTALIFPTHFSFPSTIISRYCRYPLHRYVPSKINLVYHLKFINNMESNDFLHRGIWDTQWVMEAIEFMKNKSVSTNEWVFTTYNNAVFLFYSDFKVQLIWPIRKSFLDSYQKRFWVLIGPYDHESSACNWFYKFSGVEEKCKYRNYIDKIKTAKKYTLPSGTIIYECNSSLKPENIRTSL